MKGKWRIEHLQHSFVVKASSSRAQERGDYILSPFNSSLHPSSSISVSTPPLDHSRCSTALEAGESTYPFPAGAFESWKLS